MEGQATDTVVMVRPACFGYDAETAASNAFQRDLAMPPAEAASRGRKEFDGVAMALSSAGVRVLVLDDPPEPAKPDAVFPNNWFSTHRVTGSDGAEHGAMVVYPMATALRRLERDVRGVSSLLRSAGFAIDEVIDLSGHEHHGLHLEGTGSMVLDRTERVVYACRSPRTDVGLLGAWCELFGYEPMVFDAIDGRGVPLYHTNVLMWIGTRMAAIGAECIPCHDRARVMDRLARGGRTIIELSPAQVDRFAGNGLELRCAGGGSVLALSRTGEASLNGQQRGVIESCAGFVAVDIPTIEALGGGSVRCMIAEVFLPVAPTG